MAKGDFTSPEAIAQEAAKDLLADVNAQEQLIAKEHDLKTKLFVWDNIMEHLNSLVAENSKQHSLLLAVVDKLVEMRNLIESYEIAELRLIREEKTISAQIGDSVAHKNWKLVRIEKKFEKKKAKKYEKLELSELRKLKQKFFELGLLIEKSNAITINIGDTRTSPEDFKRNEEYYFLQLSRFADTYFKIMADLLTKEELLLRNEA